MVATKGAAMANTHLLSAIQHNAQGRARRYIMAHRVSVAALRQQRDTNRKRCYRWEWETTPKLGKRDYSGSRKAAKGLARLAAKVAVRKLQTRHGLSDERTKAILETFRAHFTNEPIQRCWGGAGGVFFAGWGWTDWVILHEVAHWIDHHEAFYLGKSRAGHGPDWLGWFRYLLIEVGGYSANKLNESLREHRLQATFI